MADSLILTAPSAMTAPLPGTPKLRLVGDVFTLVSDSFSGADVSQLGGRITDSALGGTPATWEASGASGIATSGGKAVAGTNTVGASLVPLPAGRSADCTASIKLETLASTTTTNALYLIVRRNGVASTTSQCRLAFSGTQVTLNITVDGVNTFPAGTVFPIAAGETWGIREYNGLVQMIKNGVVIKELTGLGPFNGNYAGLARVDIGGPWAVDDFKVIETVR